MMNPELLHYLSEFRQRRAARRWWLRALVACAVAGGIYGAAMGSAIGAVPGAVDVIQTAAAIFALVCAVPGTRVGFLFGWVNRARFGSLLVGAAAAIAGAILGGFLATMILLALGAILGAIIGWVLARALLALRHGILRRLLVGIAGALLGTFLGAILWALRLNQSAAFAGAMRGLGIGLLAGPLLLLAFFAALRGLPRWR